MNSKRLESNIPVLIRHIMDEYNLTTYDISKVFGMKIKTIDNWINGNTMPDRDIIRAMMFAYTFMKFYKPFRTFLRLIFFILKRSFGTLYSKFLEFKKTIKSKVHLKKRA